MSRRALTFAALYLTMGIAAPLIAVQFSPSPSPETINAHPAPVRTPPTVVVSPVTVTEAAVGEDSALVFHLTNGTSSTITLTSLSSPVSSRGVLHYDENMCRADSTMVELPNISIAPHSVQELGYRFQGAMLMKLRQSLPLRARVAVSVTWQRPNSAPVTTRRWATVVAAPAGLNFGSMASMRMQ